MFYLSSNNHGHDPPTVANLGVPCRHKTDGCHKRFDIGTMDLRAEGQEYRVYPPPNLPPLTMPPQNAPVPPSRERGPGEPDLRSSWNR